MNQLALVRSGHANASAGVVSGSSFFGGVDRCKLKNEFGAVRGEPPFLQITLGANLIEFRSEMAPLNRQIREILIQVREQLELRARLRSGEHRGEANAESWAGRSYF